MKPTDHNAKEKEMQAEIEKARPQFSPGTPDEVIRERIVLDQIAARKAAKAAEDRQRFEAIFPNWID